MAKETERMQVRQIPFLMYDPQKTQLMGFVLTQPL